MSGCCPEKKCRRKQSMLIQRDDFTGDFYVVTRWTKRDEHSYEANERHRLPDSVQKQMKALVDREDS